MEYDNILLEVIQERERQDEQWGGPEHDDSHFIYEWLQFIDDQYEKGMHEWICGGGRNKIRARLVKIAALAFAGIESIDRNGESS